MDLGAFAEEVLDAVAGICGDVVVESQTQAAHVIDALCRRPGSNHRELAAVFGVSPEQFEHARARGKEESKDSVYTEMCRLDAVYTWNALIQRINYAAHWREEFREMQNAGDGGTSSEEEDEVLQELEVQAADGENRQPDADGENRQPVLSKFGLAIPSLAPQASRAKAKLLLEKQLDGAACEVLKGRLARRLEAEVFEHLPNDKDYKCCVRGLVANLRRNPMLAGGYVAGRVPPQWIVLADHEALATRMHQLQRRALRTECLKEVRECEEAEKARHKQWAVAKGHGLGRVPDLLP
ncbi:unnamed protein product [Polarella glacialis]|uniref:TFIIS central domain-containing protein n=1 Tax=Polarella glacialis TaxID=89957 RepID=A0A813HVJ1_POLGL|nr:unnamed protein product [Polarella glacialis]CAE8738255.1 unnamed protein product [Polarella glacialis]